MKKVTKFHDKRLQFLLKRDDEFRKTKMFHYANKLVDCVVELVEVGHAPIHFPIAGAVVIPLGESNRKVFDEVREKASRAEAQMGPGVADACIFVVITFFGNKNNPLLSLFGGVDSDGARKLDVMMVSNTLESIHLIRARQFALIGPKL
ncbi:MAG: hypothetical protein UR90_C0016G0006 [Parcubacteria group bacterium GW2011_GWC1_35_8]|uniref:Uncharacterized protein n=2 Tax=Candidatus Nomuraibacteriota TaxID=1752729 RepID=A0A1F6YS36_9BACT|nr:MAG: hypothetical protein UR90_C0016G0006 [Parcubacteria group bacterium GW2011_GWC1_35_8]KKP88405.1 MAG: hypothetical protein UR91_C0019G0010 [Candidatus Nomurabacteria bacterium GW2011_GWC2_35_8]OGJ05476.1 MAG: hypothetical protein A2238_02595 [Candidatus Nomurabacteria bacterium RIFOXYA2_FULL_35_9]OGJ09148.1 MAG: hypothetical protein A2456_02120 [Candidatus Nomurabacteria bacterium RIFOXYC2_FULL_36_19]OGJ14225.1 MAG: hypothetical protein A2554_01695 [Candidatus Nomurabacteria bacterium RI